MASVFDSASIVRIMYRESKLDQYSKSNVFIVIPTSILSSIKLSFMVMLFHQFILEHDNRTVNCEVEFGVKKVYG
jgi:hypothetical protein